METYGPVAVVVWLTLFGLTWAGFALAISQGVQVGLADPEVASPTGTTAGVVGAAYVATQLTKPARALAALALTPVFARLVGRHPPAEVEGEEPTSG